MSNTTPSTTLGPDQVLDLVISSLTDILEMNPDGAAVPDDLGRDSRLIGSRGLLDSMGLVNLIVDVEQRLEEEYDVIVILADDRAMSQKRSPFLSIGSLTDYIGRLVEEQG